MRAFFGGWGQFGNSPRDGAERKFQSLAGQKWKIIIAMWREWGTVSTASVHYPRLCSFSRTCYIENKIIIIKTKQKWGKCLRQSIH